jgi:hypothetical protein
MTTLNLSLPHYFDATNIWGNTYDMISRYLLCLA